MNKKNEYKNKETKTRVAMVSAEKENVILVL